MLLQGVPESGRALFEAVISDNLDSVLKTLEACDARNALGRNALFFAKSAAVANVLMDQGGILPCAVDAMDVSAARAALEDGRMEVLQILISRLSNENESEARQLLEAACEDVKGADVLDWLVERFPELQLDVANSKGLTPLLIASKHGRLEVVKRLLNLGCDVGACDGQKGRNAMHFAVIGRHADLVSYLLEVGDEEMTMVMIESLDVNDVLILFFLKKKKKKHTHTHSHRLLIMTKRHRSIILMRQRSICLKQLLQSLIKARLKQRLLRKMQRTSLL